MPEPIPPAPNPTPTPAPLPDVAGYVKWPQLVQVLIASVFAGGLTVEGLALTLSNVSAQFDQWYVGPNAETIKFAFAGLVTIAIGLISGYKIARAGVPPTEFKRIAEKNSDDRY